MRPTLPSLIALVFLGCGPAPAPVVPGPPIYAVPDVQVGTMQVECEALQTAFDGWRACPNLDDPGRRTIDAYSDLAKQSFEAGSKANPDDKSQRAIAIACQRAAKSARAATERCNNGRPPPRNY